MSRISLIAAMAGNRVIGIENRLPWRLPDDLQHFKQLTLGKAIVMGRKTWESLPGLLPNRRHIVITRDQGYQAQGAEVVNSIEQAIEKVSGQDEVLVVGGANLYEQVLPMASTMYLTFVDAEIKGDAYFPQWDKQQWNEVEREHHAKDERHNFSFDFVTLQRNQLQV